MEQGWTIGNWEKFRLCQDLDRGSARVFKQSLSNPKYEFQITEGRPSIWTNALTIVHLTRKVSCRQNIAKGTIDLHSFGKGAGVRERSQTKCVKVIPPGTTYSSR